MVPEFSMYCFVFSCLDCQDKHVLRIRLAWYCVTVIALPACTVMNFELVTSHALTLLSSEL